DKVSGIPTSLLWAANNSAKTLQLIEEIGKLENFKILFGKKDKKENTSGESKTKGFNHIGGNIWPEYTVHID
ncbi:hypothetical protein K439DRAFT_1364451, partial [Ramaria rubella]